MPEGAMADTPAAPGKRAAALRALKSAITGKREAAAVSSRFDICPLLGAEEDDSRVCAHTHTVTHTGTHEAAHGAVGGALEAEESMPADAATLLYRIALQGAIVSESSWADAASLPDPGDGLADPAAAWRTSLSALAPRLRRFALRRSTEAADTPVVAAAVIPAEPADTEARLKRLVSHRAPVVVSGAAGDQPVAPARGVDATGLVRVWAAERIFAHLITKWANLPIVSTAISSKSAAGSGSHRYFDRLNILELGAGSSGLLGLQLAISSSEASVVVTDGNTEAARCLAETVCINRAGKHAASFSGAESDCLVWDAAAACARAGCAASEGDGLPVVSRNAAFYPRTALSSVRLEQKLHAAVQRPNVPTVAPPAVLAPGALPTGQYPAWDVAMSATAMMNGMLSGMSMDAAAALAFGQFLALVPFQLGGPAPALVPVPPPVITAETPTNARNVLDTPITPATAMAWLPQLSPIMEPMSPMPPPASATSASRQFSTGSRRRRTPRQATHVGAAAGSNESTDTPRPTIAPHSDHAGTGSHRTNDNVPHSSGATPSGRSRAGDTDSTTSELILPEPARVRSDPSVRVASSRLGAAGSFLPSPFRSPTTVVSHDTRASASVVGKMKYDAKYRRRRAAAATRYMQGYREYLQAVQAHNRAGAPATMQAALAFTIDRPLVGNSVDALIATLERADDDDVAVAQTVLYLVDSVGALAHGDKPPAFPRSKHDYPDFSHLRASFALPTPSSPGLTADDDVSDMVQSAPGIASPSPTCIPADTPEPDQDDAPQSTTARIHPEAATALSNAFDSAVDLVVAADILFFEHSHRDLLHALWTILKAPSSARLEHDARMVFHTEAGVTPGACAREEMFSLPAGDLHPRVRPQAWILAPSRGGSLQRFLAKAHSCYIECGAGMHRAFEVDVYPCYDAALEETHASLVGDASSHPAAAAYDPDIHRPLLVILRKVSAVH